MVLSEHVNHAMETLVGGYEPLLQAGLQDYRGPVEGEKGEFPGSRLSLL